jgi:flagellar biosynthesis activator protein FlaF
MSPNPYEKVNVYGKNQKIHVTTGNSRDTDARALLTCASKLNGVKELMESGDLKSKKNLKIYGEAIRKNQRLWTIFQVAMTDPENPLPDALKITLFNLSRYVDKTSFKAIGKYAPDLIDSLININRIIAAGLSKQPAGESTSASASIKTSDMTTSLMTSA